ncbi:hypothetical protein [Streptomyces sp. NPDC017673]|uniref:hypothetical protein n=1 Tax=unclassified Streptomyces TaxID=2593676 RepID=UPI0037B756C1
MYSTDAPDGVGKTSFGRFASFLADDREAPDETVGLKKRFVAISQSIRSIVKSDMKLNDALPAGLEVDHNSFEVTIGGATTLDARTEIDGVTIPRAYVSEVPMAQRYFLF